jgi:ABC-2 type transport system permease protein
MSKEFLALLRDKMVFSYAAAFDLNHIPYAAYEQDSDFVSRELLGRFHGSSAFQQVATITHGGQVAPPDQPSESVAGAADRPELHPRSAAA